MLDAHPILSNQTLAKVRRDEIDDSRFNAMRRETVRNALEEPKIDRERALDILLHNLNSVDVEVHLGASDHILWDDVVADPNK